AARLRTGSQTDRDRQHAEDRRERGHENRTKPYLRRLYHGFGDLQTAGAELIRVLHDQDRVLGDEPDEHDQPDLREDVHALPEDEERDDRSDDRERNREEDRERVDEALELGREHQVDE